MNKYELIYRTIAAIIGAITGYLYGSWYPLMGILIAFVVIDYGSGVLAAAYLCKLSSKVGFRGIAKKIMIFFIVAVAHLSDVAFGFNHVVMNAAIYFYLANELISIIENAGRMDLPVPNKVKNMVELLNGKDNAK
ncbi:phage holin family protein [Sporolactobacillus sp. CQH2019]|uniref:phage holin family protein n=1 Tax=Sporolactobacillus sp. CQH2019 TaxID=3023512 RepID=UPI002368C07B|nr:phage holin family protein [Sporolactobacillus sp. CQH2019]MDD9149267.1 phage holin family protein [Sporolactobacillus sp. CQH2019]